MNWDEHPPIRVELEPLTRDRCEVCGLTLYPSERVEITEGVEPGSTEFGFGGGGVSATYCHEHAPLEAT